MSVKTTTDAVLGSRSFLQDVIIVENDLVDLPLTSNIFGLFSGAISFLRNSIATVIDFESRTLTVLVNEIRFSNARRVHNLAVSTEDMTNPAYTTSNAVIDNATEVTFAGILDASVLQTITIADEGFGRQFVFSVEVRLVSGTINQPSQLFIGILGDGISNATSSIGSQITGTLKRFTILAGSSSSGTEALLLIFCADAVTLEITKWQLEEVSGQSNQNPSEYVSEGVESFPFHGAGADSVEYFETTNGNIVVSNLVIDGIGSALPNLKGYLREDTRTNLILNSDVMVTQNNTMTATTHSLSFTGTGTITLSGTSVAGPLVGTGPNDRVALFYSSTAGTLTLTVSGTVEKAQNEDVSIGALESSWIPTEGSPVTRDADQMFLPTANNFNDTGGKISATIDATLWSFTGGQIIGDGTEAPLLADTTNSGIQSFDGTNTADGPVGTPSGQITVSCEWGNGLMQAFSDGIGGAITPYDGSFNLGQINIGQGNWFGNIMNLKISSLEFSGGEILPVQFDFTLDSTGDILTEDFFDTSILMSLFTDRRASASEVPISQNRRGWIGNEFFEDNFEIGSKLWLFDQSVLNQDVTNSIQDAAKTALEWLVDDGYAIRIDVRVIKGNTSVTLEVDIFRSNSKVEHRFYDLWQASGITEIN